MTEKLEFSFDKHVDPKKLRLIFNQNKWAQKLTDLELKNMLEKSSVMLGVWEGNRLVGFARAVSDGVHQCVIEDVIVDESYRGTGIGTKIVELIVNRLSDVEHIYLFTSGTEKLRKFYERIGFSFIPYLKTRADILNSFLKDYIDYDPLPMDLFRYRKETDKLDFSFDRPVSHEEIGYLFEQTQWAQGRTVEGIKKMLDNSAVKIGVWEGNRLVGFARAVSDGIYRCVIEDVIVDESYRGKGIGTKIMKLLVEELSDVEHIYLFTSGEKLKKFYEKFDFSLIPYFSMRISLVYDLPIMDY